MSIRLDERRYVEELKRLVADFRMWKNPLVPLPDAMPLTEVPMPPQQSGSVPLPPARV